MTIKRIQKALKGYRQEYAIESPPLSIDLETFLFKKCKKYSIKTLNTKLTELKAVKFQLSLQVVLKKRKDDTKIIIEPWFNSSSSSLATKYDIESSVSAGFHEIEHNFDIFIQHGSGWVLKTSKSLHLCGLQNIQ